MSTDPAKAEPIEEAHPFEKEWNEELDRRREASDEEWLSGTAAERGVFDRFLRQRKG